MGFDYVMVRHIVGDHQLMLGRSSASAAT